MPPLGAEPTGTGGSRLTRIAAPLVLVVALGCGGEEAWRGDADLAHYGVRLENRSAQPWMNCGGVEAKVARMLDEAALRFGRDPRTSYARFTIRVVDDAAVACDGADGYEEGTAYAGCTEHWRDVVTVTTRYAAKPCLAATPLAHELGHVLGLDPRHRGPRWDELAAFWREQMAEDAACR